MKELKDALNSEGSTVTEFAEKLIQKNGRPYHRTAINKVLAGINKNEYIASEVAKKIDCYRDRQRKLKLIEEKPELFND